MQTDSPISLIGFRRPQLEKRAGNRPSEHHGQGRSEIEQAQHPAPRLGRDGEVDDCNNVSLVSSLLLRGSMKMSTLGRTMFDVSGKSALVTGGTGGIGVAIANELAAAGCCVRAADLSSASVANDLDHQIEVLPSPQPLLRALSCQWTEDIWSPEEPGALYDSLSH
jgi:short chain dehydrogenase